MTIIFNKIINIKNITFKKFIKKFCNIYIENNYIKIYIYKEITSINSNFN